MNWRTRRVLAYVNRVRKLRGMKPLKRMPQGARNQARSCPIACALHARSVSTNFIAFSDDGRPLQPGKARSLRIRLSRWQTRIRPPEYVKEWIEDFDAGKYPELIR